MIIGQRDFVDFKCPRCQRVVSFPEDWIGSVQSCPWCSQDILVPEGSKDVAREVQISARTRRLQFRRLNMGDRSDLLAIMSNADSFGYLGWQPMDEEAVDAWLERDAGTRHMEPDVNLYFAVESLSASRLVGLVTFGYQGQRTAQAGFEVLVAPAFRGQGYGTETVGGVLDFAFRGVNLRRVAVGCDSRNIAGLKMLAKAGMRREGEFVEDYPSSTGWANTVWFALLSREYAHASPTA
jgi:RimJ/RimL family protein N-acetyltransferase